MSHAKAIGRISILAVGLGIGIGTAATAGAAPTLPVDPVPVVPDLPLPAADPAAGPDLSISFDGISLFHSGTATAETGSGTFDFALASGSDSFASAGTGERGSGLFDSAMAYGTDSDAESGGGNVDSAFANGTDTVSIAEAGNFNGTSANGIDSQAVSADGNSDSAYASGQDSLAEAGGDSSTLTGNNDFAYYMGPGFGDNVGAFAGWVGDDSTGSNDIAEVFDPSGTVGSLALAGDGNSDLGAAFGDALSSTAATGGNFLVDIQPPL